MPLYSQPVLASTPVNNDFVGLKFAAHLPLKTATGTG